MQKAQRTRKLWVFFGVALTLLAGAGVGAGVYYALRNSEPENNPCPAPRVRVEAGELLGQCRPENVEKGIPQYAAFVGVPYAKPPLGELRFKAPRPVEAWQGVREAVHFDRTCTQGTFAGDGSEDCLHVNVYSSWLQKPHDGKALQPVIVHVHGGAYLQGTGNIIRPDYFVAEDIVVVTFNHRLGHMGFLSLDSDLAPGNAGLKDMVAALRWVRSNIAAFGGDPDKVTLQGCSSAAAAVHWLTLLPDTEGLFRGAIIKSGSALQVFAYTEHTNLDLSSLAMAFFRGTALFNGQSDAQILHNTSGQVLEVGFSYAEDHRPKVEPSSMQPPTVALEKRPDGGEEPKLILKDAEAYVLQPARSRVPTILGITSCEFDPYGPMYLMTGRLPPVDSPALQAVVPATVIPTDFTKKALGLEVAAYPYTYADVADDLRHHLFNLTEYDPSCDLVCRWSDFFSGTLAKTDTVRAIRMHTDEDKAPVYAYLYDYPINGACPLHAQDDKKLWPEDEVDVLPLNTTHPLALNVLRQVKLFGNFVKYGKPVPETDDTILPVEWTPMVKGEPDHFLRIGKDLSMDQGDMLGALGSFWSSLFNKYRGGQGKF